MQMLLSFHVFVFSFPGCGQTFVGDAGVITSPNHPDNHPLSLDCLYVIRVSNGSIVALAFSYFDLEPAETHSGCVYDHIEVFDGSASTASSLGKFCGNTKPALIRSTSNELLLKFHSDQSIARPGFVASYTAESPVIADACLVNNGGCSDICSRTDYGRICSCREGFSLDMDGATCRGMKSFKFPAVKGETAFFNEHENMILSMNIADENECQLPKSFHHCQQTCVNTPGSYYCMCEDGFRLSANGRSCRDVDECLLGGVRCEQRCVNIPGRYFCDCYHGYHRDVSLPHKCVDTDECREGRPDCHKCFNLQGSYRCECDAGYTAVNNQTRCADVDECSDNNGNCSQICINIEGDRLCECRVGYEPTDPESRTCRDIDECATNNGKGDCEYACANTDGSFRCSCQAGYSVGDDGLTCYDIDECQVQNGQCSQKCENKPGSHKCDCFDGFVNLGSNLTDVICIDIDECFDGIHECDSLAKCHNTAGNYTCQCPDGFYSEWKDCIDVDECSRPEVHECQQLCNNTAGSFHCSCNDGFALQGDNKTCIDIDECTLSKCEKDCVNSNGSYRCTCPAGYQLAADGHHCEDVNECLDDNGSCDHRCINENGSYSCACRRGFKLLRDEKTCRDIDECQLDTACCNQECTNTEGSYNCTCHRGYSLISNCTCAGKTDNGGCHHNCSNTPGSYQCTCHPTFRLQMDGKTCGHCPTCNDFESLLQTVEILKKKLDSIEVWRQSTNSPGCIFELEFRPNGTSWKRDPCEVCYCEGNTVRCERISGCQVPTSPTPTPAAMRHSIPYMRKARTTYNDDEEEEEVTSGSMK
ncbi:PREDICTED: fibrillin-2-like [Acropora digitifera]|uniref:fibrillin-2-like n=1 Tax=Acropora digitifera TaxID=70779 RepID=UPI00077A609B|nr:PREDICTED: fibrillin-2-like [Acropora digitifera]